ncbi:MAG: hypothetical protein IIC67_00605 [Thaumarchaeota archaeon]|nr:hypothetical protein [Nitrososphaerota archaeon]
MKTRLLIITVIAIAVFVSPLAWVDQAHASCAAEIDYDLTLEESELVFTGTVTRLDNYDGPQKVTFFIHEVIKGEIDTQKYILENFGLIFLENDSIRGSSVSVDYKIGKTYKVYVENGKTSQCTTKIVTPPADYMWEPGPEDGNYYSENPVYVDPCDEGYGLSDGVCITLEEMNKDLLTCSANPRHDFGKCKKNMEEPPNTFEQVKAYCNDGGEDIFLEWWNDDVYYNNAECDVLDRNNPDPAPPRLEPEPEPEQNDSISIPLEMQPRSEELDPCGPETELVNGICQVVKIEKMKTAGDDAPFFGIFVYFDNLISWILGK